MSIQVYGIENCNTMKKAFQLLEQEGVSYNFIDYKKQKPSEDLLQEFSEKIGLDQVVNKKGTTYRKLSEEQKAALDSEVTAFPLIMENSSMIKRPILRFPDGTLIVGLQEQGILGKIKAAGS